ncbi:hypothetical protein B0H16DRAFT_1446424 [Mycena metata]|uniref:Uncharacterized protein n=1 Tax=Mycena metata TaxID=1033252 RepID=A0AAD7KEV4_9AGAR|nr:hypothetical protein B0H16DRAFT_1446424 [Mycena metata]
MGRWDTDLEGGGSALGITDPLGNPERRTRIKTAKSAPTISNPDRVIQTRRFRSASKPPLRRITVALTLHSCSRFRPLRLSFPSGSNSIHTPTYRGRRLNSPGSRHIHTPTYAKRLVVISGLEGQQVVYTVRLLSFSSIVPHVINQRKPKAGHGSRKSGLIGHIKCLSGPYRKPNIATAHVPLIKPFQLNSNLIFEREKIKTPAGTGRSA